MTKRFQTGDTSFEGGPCSQVRNRHVVAIAATIRQVAIARCLTIIVTAPLSGYARLCVCVHVSQSENPKEFDASGFLVIISKRDIVPLSSLIVIVSRRKNLSRSSRSLDK